MSPKGNHPVPPNPEPVPEPVKEVHCTVFNYSGPLLASLNDDYGHIAIGKFNGIQIIFTLPDGMNYLTGGHLLVTAKGYKDHVSNILIEPDIEGISLIRAVTALPRLVIEGQFFNIFLLQCSDFNLFSRYQSGDYIRDVLAQRHGAGFNCLRVWTYYSIDGIGTCIPDYRKLVSFVELCAEYNLLVEFTAYVDDKYLDVNHWTNLINALSSHPEILLEYCNERHEPKDVIPARSPFHLCSRGSTLSGEETALTPVFDYGNTHWNDAFEWQRKAGHNSGEVAANYGIPIHAGENTRFPDHDSQIHHAFDVAAGCKLFNAGICYHSVRGKNSTLWDGLELDLARETVRGANSVDIKFRNGFYRDEPDGSYLRVYSKEISTGEKCYVSIRY